MALETLLDMIPSGSTYKTSALSVVSAISTAPVAARGPIIGSAVRKCVAMPEIVVVVPLYVVVMPTPVEAAAPTTTCHTTFAC